MNTQHGQQEQRPYHKPTWVIVQEIKEGTLLLEIEKSDHWPFPRFRIRLGFPFEMEGRRRLGAIQPRIDGYKLAAVTMDGSIFDAITLLNQAREWILAEAGKIAAEHNDHITTRDHAPGQVSEHRRTGKTARDREKRKNRGRE